jgi:predicted RNA-binding protein
MCLSNVFLERKEDGCMLLEEASHVDFDGETVRVSSLFGEKRELRGYRIREVNLTDNYVILQKMEGA